MAAEHLETERDVQRMTRRALVRASAECLGSCFIGLLIMAVGFHVNDVPLGKVFFYGGMVVGYAGITVALARAYRAGEERGDW